MSGVIKLPLGPIVGVLGGGAVAETDPAYKQAETVGRLLAHYGAVVLTGGGGGVMEAAAKGAKAAGGFTVSILPGAVKAKSPHIDLSIVTGIGSARNQINVLTCEGVIAIAGEGGTLSEIALALKARIPVVLLNSWELKRPGGQPEDRAHCAPSPEDAVKYILTTIGKVGPPK